MKRTQLQMDESAFAKLRAIAHARDVSVAQLIREAVDEVYGTAPKRTRASDLSFVGKGRSASPAKGRAVSEVHDAELASAFGE
jgi:hypothetical protein